MLATWKLAIDGFIQAGLANPPAQAPASRLDKERLNRAGSCFTWGTVRLRRHGLIVLDLGDCGWEVFGKFHSPMKPKSFVRV